tara:strand:+ start:563 stop:1099 length:537 start_codon:yes stop_codon:yes gene_type:complete
MSNLRLIKQTATSSGITSVSMTDVFSSDYDIYCVTVAQTTYDVTNTDVIALKLRFINSSGSIISASNYSSANMHMKAETTKDEDKFTNGTYSYSGAIIGNYENGGGVHWIYNPYNSDRYSFVTFEGGGGYDSSSNKMRSQKGIGVLEQQVSMTGVNFYSSNASNTFSAYVTVYGLRKD